MWVELVVAAIGVGGGSGSYVVEGFPEDAPTLEAFEGALGCGVALCVRLDCDEETLASRLEGRSSAEAWDFFDETEREASAGSPSDVANFVVALFRICDEA